MNINNYTPFVPLPFVNQDVDGDDSHVFVLKGTFEIINGQPLRPLQAQAPLVMADDYFGDPQSSSVRVESDIIPLKRNSEVTIDAVANSPLGEPSRAWKVDVTFGNLRKTLTVTGPRRWYHSFTGGWKLTPPEPITELPVRFENAYGGSFPTDSRAETFERNPVGKGFVVHKQLSSKREYDAPQIEAAEEPIRSIESRYAPAGLGPVARHWMPRRELCGTADEQWLSTRWPKLPLDFDVDYYNGASSNLVASGYFSGDEAVSLSGLDPDGPICFQLPRYQIQLSMIDEDDYLVDVEMNLDSVTLDVPRRRASLVWRGMTLKLSPLDYADVKVSGPGVRHAR